ncbi:MAG: hypothetical protein LBL49_04120 [Clostridiales Family XIII bacterium]|jgi:hypothetical protein|nr:hypothetical protein [Clostridiales Family XIII bacterium]
MGRIRRRDDCDGGGSNGATDGWRVRLCGCESGGVTTAAWAVWVARMA